MNANYYSNYWEKVASVARDIADGHPFLDGNKRTAYDVVSLLMERNGHTPVPEGLWNVIGTIGKGYDDVPGIADMLRGYA
jgi:prophage maintenance system killer protein